jgi:hypothetical protein
MDIKKQIRCAHRIVLTLNNHKCSCDTGYIFNQTIADYSDISERSLDTALCRSVSIIAWMSMSANRIVLTLKDLANVPVMLDTVEPQKSGLKRVVASHQGLL